MNIAFIRKSYNPFGGAENYLNTLISFLTGQDHTIHLLSSHWPGVPGVLYHHVADSSLGSLMSTITFNRSAAKVVKALTPDCTVSFERTTCQDIYRAGDGCHRVWLTLRKCMETRFRSASFAFNPTHRVLLRLEKEIFTTTPLIVANSQMVKRQIMSVYGTPENRISVAYNGVDTDRFNSNNRDLWRDAVRKQYGIGAEEPLVLFLGSGFKRKGLQTLIKSMAFLDREAKLLVVGKGDREKYGTIAQTAGVRQRVIFTGPLTNPERLYAAADLFVLPTIYDPFSNATLEAMASGLPVVTTIHNGAAELIEEGINGAVLDNPMDYEDLGTVINALLYRTGPMGEAAALKAQEFSLGRAASVFMEIVEEYMKGKE